MKIYRIEREQRLGLGLQQAWDFFLDPRNLMKITPDFLGFEIINEEQLPPAMYAGLIIEYRVRPLLAIAMQWITEITHAREPFFFVDEQRFGPYAFWHHEHFFQKEGRFVLMRDVVSYALPFGLLGDLAHQLYVRNSLDKIFSYRQQILNTMFPINWQKKR